MHSPLGHLRSLFLKTRPIHLTYFVTRRCNAGCGFCFYPKAGDSAPGEPELSLDEVRRIAASMDPLLWVLFSGGEPFLRQDLAEISAVFHDTSEAAFLTYPTNGLLPEVIVDRTEEILKRCPESAVVLKLSLDGLGERHDALRGTPGAFAKVLATYEGLRRLADGHPRLELGVNTVYCPENQWRMDEIVDFVHGLDGIRSHTLTLLRPGPQGGPSGAVDLDQYRRTSRRLESRWRSRRQRFHRFAGGRLKAALDRLQRRLIHRTVTERRRIVPCFAGRLDLVLTESGNLHPCETRWDRSFGNVRDVGCDVGRLLHTERARDVVEEIARTRCHCSHECNFITNILFNPLIHPALLREYLWPEHGSSEERSTTMPEETQRNRAPSWAAAMQDRR
jgi:MoaA/NifB/PqqE/SkfB family radical SAM enzyme